MPLPFLGSRHLVSTLYYEITKMRKYTEQQFILAITESKSISQVLLKLGLKPCGGNYQSFKNYVKKLNIDTSHFTGQLWSKGKKTGPKKPTTDYLNNSNKIGSYKLKLRLIKENYFEKKCYNCNNTQWLDKSIPLELEHIDGNRLNNNLNNLTLLCPNCHALTSTYRGKNKGVSQS